MSLHRALHAKIRDGSNVRISLLYYLWRRRHTTVWLSDLGSSFLPVTCLHLVTFLVVLELFFSCGLPWVVNSISVGLLLSLKFTGSPLQHAICHLFGNGRVANHSCLGYTETVFPLLSRHTVFPNSTKLFIPWKCKKSKAWFFPCRIVDYNWATEKRALFSLPLFLLAFRHLETLYILSLVFIQTENRKSELCKASILSLSLVEYIGDPFLDPCCFCLY